MNQIFHLLNLKQHVRALWDGMWGRTQERFRRMCVLASLHASLVQCSEDDTEKLGEVNAEFKLANDVKVLRFPTLLAPLIWKNLEAAQAQNRVHPSEDVQPFLKNIPKWLQYGDKQALEEDIRMMLRYCSAKKGQV